MPLGLTEAIALGNREIWAMVGALWLLSTMMVLAPRGAARPSRFVALLALASATALMAFFLASALSIPRLTWRTVDEPLLLAQGSDTFRKLRGPAVHVKVDGVPDFAVPTIDDRGRWVLYALLAARPLTSVSPADPSAPEPGGPRLCTTSTEPCRAWPLSWPSPGRAPALSELEWSAHAGRDTLVYDPETRNFLHDAGHLVSPGDARMDLAGSLSAEAAGDGPSAVFSLRRLTKSGLQAMRIIHVTTTAGPRYFVQRATVSVLLGPRVRWIARPVLGLIAFALPIGLLVSRVLPAWLAKRAGTLPSAARTSLIPRLHALTTLAIGLALAAPALIAMASMLAVR
jgi:hypothetical protein